MEQDLIANFMLSAAIVLAIASPMTGSFLKCWADRSRAGLNVADGRSFCDNCEQTLAARDLVPIASWLLAGGKSRCCNEKISPTLLLSEVVSTAMAVSALIVLPVQLWLAALLLAWAVQATALLTSSGIRPGAFTATAAAAIALAISYAWGPETISFTTAVLGCGVGLVLVLAMRQFQPTTPPAALLLPTGGALLGAAMLIPVLVVSVPIAFAHYRALGSNDTGRNTSISIGLAAAIWVLWLGQFVI